MDYTDNTYTCNDCIYGGNCHDDVTCEYFCSVGDGADDFVYAPRDDFYSEYLEYIREYDGGDQVE